MKLPLTAAFDAESALGSCRRTAPANDPDHEVPLMSTTRRPHPRTSSSGQHRAKRRPRLRLAVTGAATLAVLGGGTAFACLGVPQHRVSATTASAHADRTGGQGLSRVTVPTPGPSHGGVPSATVPTGHPTRPAHHHSAAPTHAPGTSPAPATHAPTPPPVATTAPATRSGGGGDAVQQVLALINRNRAAQGLAPYTLSSGLNASAAAHNSVMASGCGLSHQCPGEAAFGDRETAAGVHWTSAGENIGEGGGVADTEAAKAASAVGLTQMMLNEKAPDDGHRKNILNSGYTRIGIAILRDAKGTLWLTQDFAN